MSSKSDSDDTVEFSKTLLVFTLVVKSGRTSKGCDQFFFLSFD